MGVHGHPGWTLSLQHSVGSPLWLQRPWGAQGPGAAGGAGPAEAAVGWHVVAGTIRCVRLGTPWGSSAPAVNLCIQSKGLCWAASGVPPALSRLATSRPGSGPAKEPSVGPERQGAPGAFPAGAVRPAQPVSGRRQEKPEHPGAGSCGQCP